MLLMVLLNGGKALFSTKIWIYLCSKHVQWVKNWHNINSKTLWKMFFINFQGVESVKCKIFSLVSQELTTCCDLHSKFSVLVPFSGKNSNLFLFSILSTFSWKIDKLNLAEGPTEWENPHFSTKISIYLFSKCFQGDRT